jgi:hypothetical protein
MIIKILKHKIMLLAWASHHVNLNVLFSSTPNLCSSFNVEDLFKPQVKLQLQFLIKFLDRCEHKKFWTAFTKYILIFIFFDVFVNEMLICYCSSEISELSIFALDLVANDIIPNSCDVSRK